MSLELRNGIAIVAIVGSVIALLLATPVLWQLATR